MCNTNCNCYPKIGCTVIAVIVSIIIGVITAFLTTTATVAITTTLLYAALGTATVYLAVTLLTAPYVRGEVPLKCVCSALSALIWGILGTILTALILLVFDIATASILGAIITGAFAAFVALIFTSTACYIKCIIGCNN